MKLLEGGTILECKSLPEFWAAEQMHPLTQGAKCNTVRFVDAIEHMTLMEAKESKTLTHIRIRNTETDETFLRRLTDFRPFASEFVVSGVVLWAFSF